MYIIFVPENIFKKLVLCFSSFSLLFKITFCEIKAVCLKNRNTHLRLPVYFRAHTNKHITKGREKHLMLQSIKWKTFKLLEPEYTFCQTSGKHITLAAWHLLYKYRDTESSSMRGGNHVRNSLKLQSQQLQNPDLVKRIWRWLRLNHALVISKIH